MDTNTENPRDYRGTLNITLSDKDPGAFPQRGSLPTKEPERMAKWDALNLYRRSLEKDAPNGTFVLHDGPPYSNGDIHLGHALNKVAKDITTRYKTMQGFRSPYVPGWDNHGMPIENAVVKKFRDDKQTVDRVTLRKACREYAANWVETQREQFQRLGIRGDWHDPYLTMSYEFEAAIVETFGDLATAGYIYRGLRPVMWCANCETALADAEIEYEPHVSNSIYVRFPLHESGDPNGVFAEPFDDPLYSGYNPYVLIWTTTPWTIPANLAVAVHPEAEYVVVGVDDDAYLVAEPLLEACLKVLTTSSETPEGISQEDGEFPILRRLKGSELEGLVFQHPLFERPSPVVLADYVTMDTGTGIVHTAPGHGKEDFETGQKYGMEILNPVDGAGRYTAQAGEYNGVSFQGLRVTPYPDKKNRDSEANVALLKALEESGNLMQATKYEHSYPHCWRCHGPLIFRATVQWFMNIDHEGFRQKAQQAIEAVTWFPKESINRITNMVANRPDWCVSRQRSWGVGIPVFFCNACNEPVMTKESVGKVVELTLQEGSDAWYARTPAEILGADYRCPHCNAGVDGLRKETDVLDVWFDSGSTNRAVLEKTNHWPELHWPADVYLEGGDQHRGWFNSSLMIGTATRGRAPYKTVVTNGWTLDENGEAFSKSKGNGVNPLDVIKVSGADVLRCWVVSQNFMEDTRCGDNLLKQVGESYRGLRNTFRFLVNNLYDFDVATDAVAESEMEEVDRWVLAHLNRLVQDATVSYETYEFHRVFHSVFSFCTVELSAFYLDTIKDRLYASGKTAKERRSAQTTLHRVAETLSRLLAPILVFTADEVWDYLNLPNKPESVHLAAFPVAETVDEELLARWEPVLALRETVKKAVEEARLTKAEWAALDEAAQAEAFVNPLEARVELIADAETYATLEPYENQLAAVLSVSQVRLMPGNADGLTVTVGRAQGVKCARCWLVKTDVGVNPAYPEICGRCASAIG